MLLIVLKCRLVWMKLFFQLDSRLRLGVAVYVFDKPQNYIFYIRAFLTNLINKYSQGNILFKMILIYLLPAFHIQLWGSVYI